MRVLFKGGSYSFLRDKTAGLIRGRSLSRAGLFQGRASFKDLRYVYIDFPDDFLEGKMTAN